MTEGHQKCSDYIVAELKKSCDEVSTQPLEHLWTTTGKTVKMWNIIGSQNWKTASTRVVLFAHWDTRPTAEQDPNLENRSKPIPGANDGASGVAVLLELARVLKQTKPNLGVMYVMTDGEDLGPGLEEMFLGARYWALHLPTPKPQYGILLDMIGQKNVHVPMEPNSMHYAGNFMVDFYRFAQKIGLGDAFPMEEGPEIEDDHLSINDAGVPTIDLIDFDYMPYWHTLVDTPDKCSPDSLGKIGKMLQMWLQQKPAYQYR
jgi:Zn-dependent M28 family amino/carboxypeptidase